MGSQHEVGSRCPMTDTFDPKVIYDQYAGRFVVVPPNRLLGGDAIQDGFVDTTDISGVVARFGQTTADCQTDGLVVDVNCDQFVDTTGFAQKVPITICHYDFHADFNVSLSPSAPLRINSAKGLNS